MAAPLDALATHYLTRRYLFALGMVALLSLASQVIIQRYLQQQHDDARVLTLAGRQRMLSQELVKSALAWSLAHGRSDLPQQQRYRLELDRVLDEWASAQDRLTSGTDAPASGGHNSPEIAAAFIRIAPQFNAMRAAARHIDSASVDAGIDQLLRHEPEFLGQMESIVDMYAQESSKRVHVLILLEVCLCAVLLGVLAIEALLVFRPAMAWLREAMQDRERARDQELINREIAVSVDVARNIGYDLHDGVGQTLTALSLQARYIEVMLGDHPMTAQVAGLRLGLAESLIQTRAAARRLAPVDIQSFGLEAALRDLAEATASLASVSCHIDGRFDVKPEGAQDLFHIAQEAVTNALRHGQGPGRSMVISLDVEKGEGVLRIRDDGCHAVVSGEPGLGLRSMRHRAERLGGRLEAGAHPGGGWQVACYFPLRHHSS